MGLLLNFTLMGWTRFCAVITFGQQNGDSQIGCRDIIESCVNMCSVGDIPDLLKFGVNIAEFNVFCDGIYNEFTYLLHL